MTAKSAISIEVDTGSASSRGRTPDRAWLVRLRNADRTVIIAIGLRRHAADRLAQQIDDLLNPTNLTTTNPSKPLDIYRSFRVRSAPHEPLHDRSVTGHPADRLNRDP